MHSAPDGPACDERKKFECLATEVSQKEGGKEGLDVERHPFLLHLRFLPPNHQHRPCEPSVPLSHLLSGIDPHEPTRFLHPTDFKVTHPARKVRSSPPPRSSFPLPSTSLPPFSIFLYQRNARFPSQVTRRIRFNNPPSYLNLQAKALALWNDSTSVDYLFAPIVFSCFNDEGDRRILSSEEDLQWLFGYLRRKGLAEKVVRLKIVAVDGE